MVFPFPVPGGHVRLAYRELHIAINGTEEEKKALGNHALLSRPWEPATCLDPELRHDLWDWLDDVVIWLNREYTWDVSGLIPSCWPLHPHLRSEDNTSELQSIMRHSYHASCLNKKTP